MKRAIDAQLAAWQEDRIRAAIAEADAGNFDREDEVTAAFVRWGAKPSA